MPEVTSLETGGVGKEECYVNKGRRTRKRKEG